jgi:hypothetical protein
VPNSDKAAELRRQAVACFEVAERMSLKADRARMIELAEHWLGLAKRAELELHQAGSKKS